MYGTILTETQRNNAKGRHCLIKPKDIILKKMQKQGIALHLKWPEHPAKEDFTDLAEAANGMKVKRGNQCKARNFLEV